jgi:hypothetical protein
VTDIHGRFGDAVHVHEGRSVVAMTSVPVLESPEFQCFAAESHIQQKVPFRDFAGFEIGEASYTF